MGVVEIKSDRAGRLRRDPSGYDGFVPAPFPPSDLGLAQLADLIEKATLALGRLVGSAEILPNPDLFVMMYVRREAVLSSQIEGTEASLVDLLEYEAELERSERKVEVKEIANYVSALRFGLDRVVALPLSLRLIREIHEELMTGVRGGEPSKTPGEFRTSQNWVGGPTPVTARFVPPPVDEMHRCLDELERFLRCVSGAIGRDGSPSFWRAWRSCLRRPPRRRERSSISARCFGLASVRGWGGGPAQP
ncbi:MAG: Fic/DOC family N-terminal domain-containing protein [Longimicrobiales bacterium]|nr:Fic/DOC family N-terminal domain-containing protein [Longimicrobiales bacterium]